MSRYNETGLREDESWKQFTVDVIKNIATVAVCGYVLLLADVVGVMMKSKKVLRAVLYTSGAAYAVFFAIWLYILLFVQRRNPNWENTHMHLIYVATGSVTLGGVLWVIAVWPVFHIWTIPLGLAALFLFLSLMALVPASKRKAD